MNKNKQTEGKKTNNTEIKIKKNKISKERKT